MAATHERNRVGVIPATLLSLLLADAALETFWSGSPVRWWVVSMAGAYALASAVLWKRVTLRARNAVSLLVLMGIVALTAWLPGGLTSGVRLLGQSTATVLSLTCAAGVALATLILARHPKLPRRPVWLVVPLGAYGVIAFVYGAINGTPFASLLAGDSLWRGLPYVLQSAVVGGFVVLPLALLVSTMRAGLRTPAPGSTARAIRHAAALAATLAIVVAAVPQRDAPVVSSSQSAASAPSGTQGFVPSTARLAALENSFGAIEVGERQSARDLWDPDYVTQQIGRDPRALFEWVRDNTYWIPYRGALRGPVGVLMDRLGNSLDRSLLLATLLEKAGHPVRLANGEMDREAAAARMPVLMAARSAAVLLSEPGSIPTEQEFQAVAQQHHLDAKALQQTLAVQYAAARTLLSTLTQRVANQTRRLNSAIGGSITRANDRNQRFGAAVDALRDHWWVQWNDGTAWVDLDLLAYGGSAGEAPAAVQRTVGLAAATDGLHHEMAVRLITEQWAGGALSERQVLEHVLRPLELHGTPIVLQIWPVDWPSDFPPGGTNPHRAMRSVALEQHQWLATFTVGRNVVATSVFDARGEVEAPPRGGPMAGLGGALGRALRGPESSPADGKVLTAAWFEYEIRAPGESPRKIRRDIFDLLEPAARASTPVAAVALDDARRVTRALALTMRTEILPVSCRIAPEYLLHLVSQAMLSNRELVRSLARGELRQETSSIEQIASRASRMPSPLYLLAFVRSQVGRLADDTYIDRLGIFSRHTLFVSSPAGIRLRDATDIVANEIGVDPTVEDPFGVRLEQGVLDTNAEALLHNAKQIVGSTAEAFASSSAWVTLRSPGDARIDDLAIPERARWRIRQELATGLVVVAPTSPVRLASQSYVGWWRIDPQSGDTLGVNADGWGATAIENAMLIAAAAEAGFLFEYIWCKGDFGIKGESTDIARVLPRPSLRSGFAWMDVFVVPVEAASDCFWSALVAALIAAGVQVVAVTWPFIRLSFLRLLRRPAGNPALPPAPPTPPPPEPPQTDPPGSPPNRPPNPKPPEECPGGQGGGGGGSEPSPTAPGKPPELPEVGVDSNGFDEMRPLKRSVMKRLLEETATKVRAAEQALDESLGVHTEAKARYEAAARRADAVQADLDRLRQTAKLDSPEIDAAVERVFKARLEAKEASDALGAAERRTIAAEKELKAAERSSGYWHRQTDPNEEAVKALEELREADARFSQFSQQWRRQLEQARKAGEYELQFDKLREPYDAEQDQYLKAWNKWQRAKTKLYHAKIEREAPADPFAPTEFENTVRQLDLSPPPPPNQSPKGGTCGDGPSPMSQSVAGSAAASNAIKP